MLQLTRWVVAALVLGQAAVAAAAPPFSGARAHQLMVEFCALGPRVPGTVAHAAALVYLRQHLERAGAEIEVQSFDAELPRFDAPVRLHNLVGRFAPDRQPRVLLGAHWDSRPWADMDPDSTRHDEPVLGANDSASGCVILLVLAEMFAAQEPAVGVDLVFFDGEDAGQPDSLGTYCVGSQEFARRLRRLPAYAIILDMVGDRDLSIRPDVYSRQAAPAIQRYVWDRAAWLGMPQFADEPLTEVFDDHVPLQRVGVPAIDLIDFDYAYWHTVEDTPDKCSAESLGLVGELVASLVYDP